MSWKGTSRVEVTWAWHPAKNDGVLFDDRPKEVDEIVLADHAHEPITSLSNQQDIERALYQRESKVRGAGRPIVVSVAPVCDCTLTADKCRYADEFDGRRFKLRDGSRIGSMTIWENVPNADEGYPNRKLAVENVHKQWAESTLAAIIEQEGHR